MTRGELYEGSVSPAWAAHVRDELPYYSYDAYTDFVGRIIDRWWPNEISFLASCDRFFLLTTMLGRKDAKTALADAERRVTRELKRA